MSFHTTLHLKKNQNISYLLVFVIANSFFNSLVSNSRWLHIYDFVFCKHSVTHFIKCDTSRFTLKCMIRLFYMYFHIFCELKAQFYLIIWFLSNNLPDTRICFRIYSKRIFPVCQTVPAFVQLFGARVTFSFACTSNKAWAKIYLKQTLWWKHFVSSLEKASLHRNGFGDPFITFYKSRMS